MDLLVAVVWAVNSVQGRYSVEGNVNSEEKCIV
jgi:hypothetical protein